MDHSNAYARRRARVLESLEPGDALLVPCAAEAHRNSDVHYPYRNHSDLLYLCGFPEPQSLVWLERTEEGSRFLMFVRERDPEREVWDGRRAGLEGAEEKYGADEALPITKLAAELPKLLEGVQRLHYPFLRDNPFSSVIMDSLRALRRGGARKRRSMGPMTLVDTDDTLGELRLLKSDEDVAALRRAVEISASGHLAAMSAVAPGLNEAELQAIVESTFLREGGAHWGYPSIVGSGANACILHYIENNAVIQDGDLVLIDAGAETEGYTGDITRTIPANGRFTPAQRELYQVVLDAQLAAIAHCRVGNDFDAVHQATLRTLVDGMIAIGLLTGTAEEALESGSYRRYYMHSTSHWLGMDVHDVGSYRQDGAWRGLEPGMALTVEPGLYVAPDDEEAPERFRGLGVRIEDDVVVTAGDPLVLSAGVPKELDEVEAACS